MSCCGNKRAAYAQQQSANNTRRTTNTPGSAATSVNQGPPPAPPKMWADLRFECIDNTALSVIGPVTGKRYQWTGKGAVQVVDYRDAGGLRPHLHSLKRLK